MTKDKSQLWLFLVNNMLNFQLVQFSKSLSQTEVLDPNALTKLSSEDIIFPSRFKKQISLTNKLYTVTPVLKELNCPQIIFRQIERK